MLEAKNRFVKLQSEVSNDEIYEFQNFEISTGQIILRRIFDSNGIVLLNLNSTKSSNFRKMFYQTFCSEWMFLDRQVEHNLRVSLRRKKEHMITLHYQVI